MLRLLTSLALFCSCISTYANILPLEHFAKAPEFRDAVLSPDGKYIAVEKSAERGKQVVAVINTETMALESFINASTSVSPTRPIWANNKRLIVRFTEESGNNEFEYLNGELTAMDFNGNKKTRIIQHQSFVTNGKDKRANKLHGVARVVHLLPDDKKYVLIRFREFKNSKVPSTPELYKIQVRTGRIKHVTKAPSYRAEFTFTPKGEPAFSLGFDKKSARQKKNHLVVHQYSGKKWLPMPDLNIDAEELVVVSQTENPEEVYISAAYNDTPNKLFRYNMKTGEKKLVFFHPKVDWTALDFDRKTNRLVAVHYDAGYPDIYIVDPNHLYSKWYPALFAAFNGLGVRITSASEDGSKLMIKAFGANEPGQFRLFDTKTKKMKYLFNAAKWIDTEQLAQAKPISLKARDGVELHGYLTQPNGVEENAPLIVMPHGGPHGVRDFWRFDRDVQFLASRGYAVLQVNFRGSGGYGHGFRESGLQKWGSEIQNDIIDATRWAAKTKAIDENRMCIMGGSFGGYSALMSPILAPDLYKCAIGFVGVYDLELMWKTGDIEKRLLGENYLKKAIGNDKKTLAAFSPAKRVDELKVPVFLIHGEEDWRVDVAHYKVMKKALEEKNHPLETMLVDKEGHGFASEKNRLKYYQRVEAFLAKHLGES